MLFKERGIHGWKFPVQALLKTTLEPDAEFSRHTRRQRYGLEIMVYVN